METEVDMSKKQLVMELKSKGYSNVDIVKMAGVSISYVYRLCGRNGHRKYRPLTEKDCIYLYWRDWLNERRLSKAEFLRMMEDAGTSVSYVTLSAWMKGTIQPSKKNIDILLNVTGLFYEDLFYREDDDIG
jgi:transcriptional regulator with XRE-family HTH domain